MAASGQHIDKKNITTIFPLAPMQEAILGVSARGRGYDPGFLQLTCTLDGSVIEDTLQRAWRHVIDEYQVLRTSLHWRDLASPVQIVHKRVDLPWHVEDLRDLSSEAKSRRVGVYLATDKAQPLDLTRVPVMRLGLFRMTDAESTMIWSCHHALLDGWSGSLVLARVVQVYETLAKREAPTGLDAVPYRDYVRWLKQQDIGASDSFWRSRLESVEAPTPLPLLDTHRKTTAAAYATDTIEEFGREEIVLSPELSKSVSLALKRHRITVGTLFQAAWAVVLGRFSGRDDVVFGATVSGRDGDLPGLETMVGLFINTLPIRTRLDGSETIGEFAERLQREQSAARRFAHTPPEQIQACTNVPPRYRLYESLVVVENYPASVTADTALRLRDLRGGITSNYPLTLVVGPGDKIELHLIFDPQLFESGVRQVLDDVRRIVEAFAGVSRVSVGDFFEQRMSPAEVVPPVPGVQLRPELESDFTPPRDALELQLKKIWERLLNVSGVGTQDDFFDLGGHSLLGIALLREIEVELGKKLPVSALFDTPTIRGIADILRDKEYVASWSPVVPIQRGGTNVPVVFLHSWDGDILMYRRVAAALAPEHPVFGVQAYGLDGATPPVDTIDEMARRYVAELVGVCPSGPVALVGFCFSVPLSLEMARLLRASGRTVALLVNIDTGKARLELPKPKKDLSFYRRRFRRLYRQSGLMGLIIDQYRRRIRNRLFSDWHAATEPGPSVAASVEDAIIEATSRAYDSYFSEAHPPYEARMTVVVTQDRGNVPEKFGPIEFWSDRVREIDVREIGGGHRTALLDPYVSELATVLRDCLTPAFSPQQADS